MDLEKTNMEMDPLVGCSVPQGRGERLIHGAGPAQGRSLYSYRAEAYGILSVMRFLTHYRLHSYTDSQDAWPGILATDAQQSVFLDTLYGRGKDPHARKTPIDLDASRVVLDVLCPE